MTFKDLAMIYISWTIIGNVVVTAILQIAEAAK